MFLVVGVLFTVGTYTYLLSSDVPVHIEYKEPNNSISPLSAFVLCSYIMPQHVINPVTHYFAFYSVLMSLYSYSYRYEF